MLGGSTTSKSTMPIVSHPRGRQVIAAGDPMPRRPAGGSSRRAFGWPLPPDFRQDEVARSGDL